METEKREQAIEGIANMLRLLPFDVEYRVRKNPKGIHVIIDLSQERRNQFMNEFRKMKENLQNPEK